MAKQKKFPIQLLDPFIPPQHPFPLPLYTLPDLLLPCYLTTKSKTTNFNSTFLLFPHTEINIFDRTNTAKTPSEILPFVP